MPAPVARMPDDSKPVWAWLAAGAMALLWALAMLVGTGGPDGSNPLDTQVSAHATACGSSDAAPLLECAHGRQLSDNSVGEIDGSGASLPGEPEEDPAPATHRSQNSIAATLRTAGSTQKALLSSRRLYSGRAPPGHA